MLTCAQATRLASDGMERRLGWRERVRLRMHLLVCAGCTNFVRQARLLRQLARRYAVGGVEGASRGKRVPGQDGTPGTEG